MVVEVIIKLTVVVVLDKETDVEVNKKLVEEINERTFNLFNFIALKKKN